MNTEKNISLIRRLQTLAQNGLTYTEGVYDLERYQELREISMQLLAEYSKSGFLIKPANFCLRFHLTGRKMINLHKILTQNYGKEKKTQKRKKSI